MSTRAERRSRGTARPEQLSLALGDRPHPDPESGLQAAVHPAGAAAKRRRARHGRPGNRKEDDGLLEAEGEGTE